MTQVSVGTTNFNKSYSRGKGEPNNISHAFRLDGDGWVVGVDVHAGGDGSSARAKLAVWGPDGEVVFRSPQQSWPNGRAWRAANVAGVRVKAGEEVRAGFWRHPDDRCQWSTFEQLLGGLFGGGGGLFGLKFDASVLDVVRRFVNFDTYGGLLTCLLRFVLNQPPLAGAWTGLTPSGQWDDLNPLFEGTMPHPPVEQGYDYTTAVQVQIRDLQTGEVFSSSFTPTAAERSAGTFSRRLRQLIPGRSYECRFRHYDSWGVASPYNAWRAFQAVDGPGRPVVTAPSGKINHVSDAMLGASMYAASYTHATGKPRGDVQVRVYNAAGTLLLHDSGRVAPTSSTSSTWRLAQFHDDLSWATGYMVQARAWDTSGVAGPFSAPSPFRTNAAPFAPTGLAPSGGQATSASTLSCSVADPDGDPVTSVQAELRLASTGALAPGYPKPMAVSADGRRATLLAGPDMTFGVAYQWRARASDGVLFGGFSGYAHFTYASVPLVVLAAPTEGPAENLAVQPSAEREPVEDETPWWTETGGTASNYVYRVADSDPYIGEWVWEMRSGGAAFHDFRSAPVAVDPSRPHMLHAGFKNTFGTGDHRFRLECLNSSGAALGELYPGTFGALSGDPDNIWRRYGGFVSPAGQSGGWPAGTVEARIVVESRATQECHVRFDAFHLARLPLGADNPFALQWHGYFDGSRPGFGSPGDYMWLGEEGDSASRGLPVLDAPTAPVVVQYSSPQSKAKKDDRVYVERLGPSGWAQTHDSGWTASNRTLIPLPSDVVANEGRFRVLVECRDVDNIVGSSAWAAFDVEYEGPPQVEITQAGGNPLDGTLNINFEPTTLGSGTFLGLEVRVASAEEGEVAIVRSTDPNLDHAVYPFPVSGREYVMRARQMQQVGEDVLESRWSEARISVDYLGRWFIKDVHGGADLGFAMMRQDDPSTSFSADTAALRPWGAALPVHFVGEERSSEGSLTMRLLEGDRDAMDQYRALGRLAALRRTACLLSHNPAGKRFVALTDISEENPGPPWLASFDVGWEETQYREDVYERELWATRQLGL